ncbi:MAG: hypothetical protein Q9196_004694 [Gyalolechia fulgens]
MFPSISTTFQYLAWQKLYETEKPFKLFVDLPAHVSDQRRTNLEFRSKDAEDIIDVRGYEASFSLDIHGFQFIKHTTSVEDFHDLTEVQEKYFKEVAEIIRDNVEDVERVVIFDWRLRTSMNEDEYMKGRVNLSNRSEAILPAVYPHIGTSSPRLQFGPQEELVIGAQIKRLRAPSAE